MTTVGVYLKYEGKFAFQIGPNKDDTAHGVVRLGGHMEEHETATDCAVRETTEEAGVLVKLENASRTFFQPDDSHVPMAVGSAPIDGVIPFYLFGGTVVAPLSVMYFGRSREIPVPSSETVAIALLSRAEILTLCDQQMTMAEFLNTGARVIERKHLDREHCIVPHRQAIFLAWAIRNNYV